MNTGADLPPGWVLVQGSEPGMPDVGAYALDIIGGRLMPLPTLGEFVVQG